MVQHCVQSVVGAGDRVVAIEPQRVRVPPDAVVVVVDGAHGVGEHQLRGAAAAQIGRELILGSRRRHAELQLGIAGHRDRQREPQRELDLLARPVPERRQRTRRHPPRHHQRRRVDMALQVVAGGAIRQVRVRVALQRIALERHAVVVAVVGSHPVAEHPRRRSARRRHIRHLALVVANLQAQHRRRTIKGHRLAQRRRHLDHLARCVHPNLRRRRRELHLLYERRRRQLKTADRKRARPISESGVERESIHTADGREPCRRAAVLAAGVSLVTKRPTGASEQGDVIGGARLELHLRRRTERQRKLPLTRSGPVTVTSREAGLADRDGRCSTVEVIQAELAESAGDEVGPDCASSAMLSIA